MSIRTAPSSLASVAFAVLLAACGDDPAPAQPDPLASLPSTYAHIVCAQAFSCCDVKERADVLFVDPPPATQAECESKLGAFLAAVFSQQRAAVDAGRLVFRADRSKACFENAEAATCDAFFGQNFMDTDADCEAAFEGAVAVGGDCASNDECATKGAICSSSAGGGMLGKCTLLGAEGEPCVDGRCQDGLSCRFAAADGMLKCIAPIANGGACLVDDDCTSGYCKYPEIVCAAPAADGQACSTNAGCASGYCDTAASLCAAKKSDGAACATSAECTSGFCDDSAGAGACAAKKAGGAPCAVGGECESGFCDQGACATATSGPVCDGQ
jgi:hypothetical protein